MNTEPKWIEHDGRAECPVPAGHDVEVRLRDGTEMRDREPEGWRWGDYGNAGDITHYRDWTAWENDKGKPKLLTEAEAADIAQLDYPDAIVAALRARGLIAEEPVDPLEAELRHAFDDLHWVYQDRDVSEVAFRVRRVVEAPRKELTREMVRGGVIRSLTPRDMLEDEDFGPRASETVRGRAEDFVTRLHAALTEALQ